MTVMIVDWLGRGGIAQATQAWAHELGLSGRPVTVVTRGGLELAGTRTYAVSGSLVKANPLATHRTLVRDCAQWVRRNHPEVVIVQNYLIPPMERPFYRAVKDVGAELVVVIHDHKLHSPLAGTRIGLKSVLRSADHVVAHSHYVADRLPLPAGVVAQVVPIPITPEVFAHSAVPLPIELEASELLALHFGTLKRRYKGMSTVLELAGSRPRGWKLAIVGKGAPTNVAAVTTVSRFVSAAELTAWVRLSAAALLPYRYATQSGAVGLAQVLGAVPVVYDVGGMREQVEDSVTGLLLPVGADLQQWVRALERLKDDGFRSGLVRAARQTRLAQHGAFRAAIYNLTNTTALEDGGRAEDERIAQLLQGPR